MLACKTVEVSEKIIAKEYGVKRYGWLVYMDKKAKEEEKRQIPGKKKKTTTNNAQETCILIYSAFLRNQIIVSKSY